MIQQRHIFFLVGGVLVLTLGFFAWHSDEVLLRIGRDAPVPQTTVPSLFVYHFSTDGVLFEARNMHESSSPYWWVNSGAVLYLQDGIGRTIYGELPSYAKWRIIYGRNYPEQTDNGYHPQNVFRLISRSIWGDVRIDGRFLVHRVHASDSSERNESNGILLLSRYVDEDTLYYAGLRVDGTAVIKKKQHGVYTTLAQRPIFEGMYDRMTKPNVLPLDTWMKLRMETKTLDDQSVDIRLFLDAEETGVWEEVLAVHDSESPIRDVGAVGIRTDFMDAAFDEYTIETI